jgi:hypothetical protein
MGSMGVVLAAALMSSLCVFHAGISSIDGVLAASLNLMLRV